MGEEKLDQAEKAMAINIIQMYSERLNPDPNNNPLLF